MVMHHWTGLAAAIICLTPSLAAARPSSSITSKLEVDRDGSMAVLRVGNSGPETKCFTVFAVRPRALTVIDLSTRAEVRPEQGDNPVWNDRYDENIAYGIYLVDYRGKTIVISLRDYRLPQQKYSFSLSLNTFSCAGFVSARKPKIVTTVALTLQTVMPDN